MDQHQLKYLGGRLAALALLGSAMICTGAYAQDDTAGSEDPAVQQVTWAGCRIQQSTR